MKPLDLFRDEINRKDDPYAYAMEHLFGICGALYRADEDIPYEWHFKPGINLQAGWKPDPKEDRTEIAYSRALRRKRNSLSVADLHRAHDVLDRYVDLLRAAGRTY